MLVGVLQYRWLGSAAAAQEAALRSGLTNGAFQVLWASSEEIQVVDRLIRPEFGNLRADRPERFDQALNFWRANTLFPGLIRSAFLLRIGVSGWSCMCPSTPSTARSSPITSAFT